MIFQLLKFAVWDTGYTFSGDEKNSGNRKRRDKVSTLIFISVFEKQK